MTDWSSLATASSRHWRLNRIQNNIVPSKRLKTALLRNIMSVSEWMLCNDTVCSLVLLCAVEADFEYFPLFQFSLLSPFHHFFLFPPYFALNLPSSSVQFPFLFSIISCFGGKSHLSCDWLSLHMAETAFYFIFRFHYSSIVTAAPFFLLHLLGSQLSAVAELFLSSSSLFSLILTFLAFSLGCFPFRIARQLFFIFIRSFLIFLLL